MAYSNLYWHCELDGSPSEKGANEGSGSFSSTVKLMVNWQDRIGILNEIVGGFQLYPRYPDSGARATNGSSTPFKARTGNEPQDTGFAAYDYAEVTIEYKLKAETGDLISESFDPTAEFMTLDYKKFQWKTAPGKALTENEAPGKLIKGLEYGIVFYMVEEIPAWIIDPESGLIETVNAAAVESKLLGLTFQPGTLLFQPPKCSRKWNFTKKPYWQLDLKLSYKKDGWNNFWRADIQDYDIMQVNTGTVANPTWEDYDNFESGDFNQIWTLGAGIVDKPPVKQDNSSLPQNPDYNSGGPLGGLADSGGDGPQMSGDLDDAYNQFDAQSGRWSGE